MTDSQPKHPGKILFDQVMTPLGVSRNKLARDIDVPVGRISDIVAGKRGVTPDTALRFAKYFGTTAELWLRLQGDYDLYVARNSSWRDAEPKVAVFAPATGGGPSAAAPSTDYPAEIPAGTTAAPTAQSAEGGIGDALAAGDENPPIQAGEDLMAAIEPQADAPPSNPDDQDIDIPEPVSTGMTR